MSGYTHPRPIRKALTAADLRARNVHLIEVLRKITQEADVALEPYVAYAGLTSVLQTIRMLAIDAINATKDHA
jgi:hypothetical protein